ncbi:MAG: dihydroorotase [Chitinophagaceae bacterium]|nr:MAG: dihydroorotase [Chitinophagaceae bacterium]
MKQAISPKSILIKQAKIVDPSSPFHGQSADILIENGKISRIGQLGKQEADQTLDQQGLQVSPGWMDIFSNFGDPGYEFRETLETGAAAAAAGGYTDVMVIPNTNPTIHNKAGVEYIVHKTAILPVTIHPIGAITRGAEGKELAEMYDMKASGAVAFSDGTKSIQSAGLLVKALQYVKAFKGILIQLPDDHSINPQGLMNESVVSTRLGLPGKPGMAEELIVARDIELAQYAGSRIHFTGISTARSLQYIREAKKNGLDVTCSVTPYHLFFCEDDLKDYDTNLKVNPPLRSMADRQALRDGIADGTIDCIASHHLPHEYDSKVLEFEYAKFGMAGLETTFAVLNTIIPGITAERIVELLSTNPRKLFGLTTSGIKEGSDCKLTIFDNSSSWTVKPSDLRSKSKNNPFVNRELKGKVIGIVNNNRATINQPA